MNWIDKLERKFGRFGIENLTWWNTEFDSVYYYLLCDRVFAHLYESIAAQYDESGCFQDSAGTDLASGHLGDLSTKHR